MCIMLPQISNFVSTHSGCIQGSQSTAFGAWKSTKIWARSSKFKDANVTDVKDKPFLVTVYCELKFCINFAWRQCSNVHLISFASIHFMQTGSAMSLTVCSRNYKVVLPGFVSICIISTLICVTIPIDGHTAMHNCFAGIGLDCAIYAIHSDFLICLSLLRIINIADGSLGIHLANWMSHNKHKLIKLFNEIKSA